jgi:hypothetical protein
MTEIITREESIVKTKELGERMSEAYLEADNTKFTMIAAHVINDAYKLGIQNGEQKKEGEIMLKIKQIAMQTNDCATMIEGITALVRDYNIRMGNVK